jgi:hypothetical protein
VLRAEGVTWVTQQTGNHNGRSRTTTSRNQQQLKSERKVNSLPPLRLEPATFGGTHAHISGRSAKSQALKMGLGLFTAEQLTLTADLQLTTLVDKANTASYCVTGNVTQIRVQ